MAPPSTAPYDWILAITTIAFIFSSFGNGANDVANSYATSVAARTLTMPQVGFLSAITEFVGAVGLGARVTNTIKNGIISIDHFQDYPGVLMLAMGSAEVGSATWLMLATGWGLPVSTTQTIVGALVGVGFASGAPIKWGWESGSVSQVAASWGIAPLLAAAFSALIFGIVKYSVLARKDPFKWAMRLIPFYFAITATVLAIFIVTEAPGSPSLTGFDAGTTVGVVLGVFFGVLLLSYVFFMPYFRRRLVEKDSRIKAHHIFLGPLLLKENPPLYWPGKEDGNYVPNYYEEDFIATTPETTDKKDTSTTPNEPLMTGDSSSAETGEAVESKEIVVRKRHVGPHERFLEPVRNLKWSNPQRWWGYFKFGLLQGVTRDVITHNSKKIRDIHSKAPKYDVRVEHLWTYAQVASAMLMSIAHGSNDVANAVGPWAAVYDTYNSGVVSTKSETPVWFLVVAGILLGLGFWFYGYHIMRALGNKITRMSPTRGFSVELGAAITVLLASYLGLPVSTTQCLTGSAMGVALMNYDLGAVNWTQLLFIFSGWVLTLPCAGLIAGLLCVMALNAPQFF